MQIDNFWLECRKWAVVREVPAASSQSWDGGAGFFSSVVSRWFTSFQFSTFKNTYIFFSNNLLLTFCAPLGLGVPFHLGFFFVLLSVRGKTTQSLASISHPASSSENDICRSPQTVLSQCYWLFSVTHMQGLVPGWWSRRFLEGFCNLEISAFASLPRLWCCTVAPRDLGTGVFS